MADDLLVWVREQLNPLYFGYIGYIGLAIASTTLIFGYLSWYFDSLRHIPGPFIARYTPVWLWSLIWRGTECRTIAALHKKYGPVVRLAPNVVDILDGSAIYPIYIKNGGFMKSPIYRNFDLHGFSTIFSCLDPGHRAVRAKAVAPIFAQQAITKGRQPVQDVIDAMITELKRRKKAADGGPVDVLNLLRAVSFDMVCVYLCGESFNGIGTERLKATAFIDNFVAGGRFFSLPGWLCGHVENWASKIDKNKLTIAESTASVEEFAARMVDKSIVEEKNEAQTYQGRLLEAGISREEAIAQTVDVMFAGTDAAGMTLSLFCWYLGRSPEK